MKANERGEGGMGLISWLLLALIVLGFMGIGPCSSCLEDCDGKGNKTAQVK